MDLHAGRRVDVVIPVARDARHEGVTMEAVAALEKACASKGLRATNITPLQRVQASSVPGLFLGDDYELYRCSATAR